MKMQMTFKVLRSLLFLSLALTLVIGGSTLSWFTASFDLPSAAEMVTGTLTFEVTAGSVYTAGGERQEGENIAWEAGKSKEFHWVLKNTGSKQSFYRAWIKSTVVYPTGEETGNPATGNSAANEPGSSQIEWSLPAGSDWKTGPDNMFYYLQPVKSGENIPLALNGNLSADAENSTCTVQLQAEAVQASHGAVAVEWPHSPGQQE